MSTRSISRWLAAATLAALLAAVPAAASPTQESIIQDDPLLLGAKDQAEVDAIFDAFKGIGVDRVRVSLFWDHVAPGRTSQTKPDFGEAGSGWPGSYPPGSWERFDRIVLASQKTGVGLLLSVTGPAPAWATPGRHCEQPGAFSSCQEGIFRPNPAEFADFVKAAGIRYSGTYPLETGPPPPEPEPDGPVDFGGTPLGPEEEEPPPPPEEHLPRVDHWSIWNEPNYPAWLLPIWQDNRPRTAAQMVAAAPHHYRQLVNAAYAGLDASGHGGDTVLIGETSPRGGRNPRQLDNAMMPAEFARELYCLKGNHRFYTGRAARLRSCPANRAERDRFVDANSGLFRAQGWAHHPYSLARRRWRLPKWRHPLRDNVSIGNIGHLTRTLDRAAAAWRSEGPRKSIWITEYGYQTTPPDPVAGVSLARQGVLYAGGEYLAYRNPRVASVAQFLLVDDKPLEGYAEDDPRRWITWQSGLFTTEGEPKPFFDDYRTPLHVIRQGRAARVFGIHRPPSAGGPLVAQIEFAPPGGEWQALRTVQVRNPRGYVSARVNLPGEGQVRILWSDQAGSPGVATRSATAGRR